jgi:hypothetical protein
MAGAYCKFCGQRCFVLRVIPDGPSKGWEGHMATCGPGMAYDREKTGHTHKTAVNPVTDPDAAAAIHASLGRETRYLDAGDAGTLRTVTAAEG